MPFKIYALDSESDSILVSPCSGNCTSEDERQVLASIEKRMAEIFLEEQKDKIGINKIGNALRADEHLESLFRRSPHRSFVIRKMTENKRAFPRVFMHDLADGLGIRTIFLVLASDFGKKSRMVDGSFITVEGIQEELSQFSKLFRPKFDLSMVLIAEMTGFQGYSIQSVSRPDLSKDYAKLVKL